MNDKRSSAPPTMPRPAPRRGGCFPPQGVPAAPARPRVVILEDMRPVRRAPASSSPSTPPLLARLDAWADAAEKGVKRGRGLLGELRAFANELRELVGDTDEGDPKKGE